MKNEIEKIALGLFAVLAVSGCLSSGDESNFSKVSSGFYVADYSGIPGSTGLESELSLVDGGAFRMFSFGDTTLFYDLSAKWGQTANGILLTESKELNLFQSDTAVPMEDDTVSLMDITGTGFTRVEYTPMRRKPYWVPYHKQTLPIIKEGDYETILSPADSINPAVKAVLSFTGTDFTYSEVDTITKFEYSAKWYQLGSVLATGNARRRLYVDSTHAFSDWDTLSGESLQRVHVTDNDVQVWEPPSGPFFGGGWTIYNKTK
jgi:hypothetical protein